MFKTDIYERGKLMNYVDLNLVQKRHMESLCIENCHFDWEEHDIIRIFMGGLPELRRTRENEKTEKLRWQLEQYYSSYNAFETDSYAFIEKLKLKAKEINTLQPDWYGLDFYAIERYMKMHRFCLITGEGGIGKSYFVKELEEELENQKIPHLCIYGKFQKDINDIDFSEIIAEKHFVFVVDALNEMPSTCQLSLLTHLKELKKHRGHRIIVTYRNHKISQEILSQLQSIADIEYEFPGVSFESALECLTNLEIPNAYLYEDILFSNNPLYLTVLAKTLAEPKLADRDEQQELNSITSITTIFERYIKKELKLKGWLKTKTVAEWMYHNDTKTISIQNLEAIVENGRIFFEEMQQGGFMSSYQKEGGEYCFFSMETLSDFLIARTLMSELPKDDSNRQIEILKQKIEKFPSLEEAFILILFDRFSPDYQHIRYLMEKTNLWDSFRKETLLKVIFSPENIQAFKETVSCGEPLSCFETFGGYANQPFNCTNYLTNILLEKQHQLELSTLLEGVRYHADVLKRLKNILYAINRRSTNTHRIKEAFWFSLWCCAAPNEKIRKLAEKLLFDIVDIRTEYRSIVISIFPQINDYYIQEAIIHVLSQCPDSEEIQFFFQKLIDDPDFLLGRSLKRIATYFQKPYGYIEWHKTNIRDDTYNVPESTDDLISHIDLVDHVFLPFRWWKRSHIDMNRIFLDEDKKVIFHWNVLLNKHFSCITPNSDCCGSLTFAQNAESLFGKNFSEKEMKAEVYYRTLAKRINEILSLYHVKPKDLKNINYGVISSLVGKCLDIANDIVVGSFMCNYYSNQFGTHNNIQDCLGYEVYDPLEYKENFPVTTPLPIFNSISEEMNDIIASKIDISLPKDIMWVKNIELTRKNLAVIQEAFTYQNHEWVMIAGRINWRAAKEKYGIKWEDKYILYCCTSPSTTLQNDGNERYLTIELEDYNGPLQKYASCVDSPHLCKAVPTLSSSSFDMIDETSLILPPAELVRNLSLTVNVPQMTWMNSSGEIILHCNNVKYSYFTDTVGCSIFMRKDIYEEYVKMHTLKFFAYTERFLPETGFADETSKHFEIENGQIQKEFFNYKRDKNVKRVKEKNNCNTCPHGFYIPLSEQQNKLHQYLEKFIDDLGE